MTLVALLKRLNFFHFAAVVAAAAKELNAENAQLKKDKKEMLELMGSGVSFMEEMISNQKMLRNIVKKCSSEEICGRSRGWNRF